MTKGTLVLAVLAACVAAITDLRTRTIPNWLTLPCSLLGLALAGSARGGEGLVLAALGALACFLPPYFLFVRGALGGGDVKLFGALGALLGARAGLELELGAFALVASFALLSMAVRGRFRWLLASSWRASLHLLAPRRYARPLDPEDGLELPMGLAILAATVLLGVGSAP